MSFFEDNIQEGSHCCACSAFIGVSVGFPRQCSKCLSESTQSVVPKKKGTTSNARKKARLARRRLEAIEAKENAKPVIDCGCGLAPGSWYTAESIDKHVKELDILINGKKGAAKQAMLIDLMPQLKALIQLVKSEKGLN